MDINAWLLLAVFTIGVIALIGFFCTKIKGFGRFATSSFLLLLIVIVSALLYVGGRFEAQYIANLFFAVVGFAGGLFTGKENGAQQGVPADRPRPAGSSGG